MFYSIVFVHGLRGHPRRTWETQAATAGSASNDGNPLKKSKGPKTWFRRRTLASSITVAGEEQAPLSSTPSTVFWPEDYLASDIPQACVWTYGYNADVTGKLFQANNKNSVSQHSRDLSVRLEREIGNGVCVSFIAKSLEDNG